jgi:cobalamin biosynthesis protein CbiG
MPFQQETLLKAVFTLLGEERKISTDLRLEILWMKEVSNHLVIKINALLIKMQQVHG